MSYYLAAPYYADRRLVIDVPAPTNSSGYDFEFEFEVQATGTDLIIDSSGSGATSDIFFLKSSAMEYRRTGLSNITMTHGVTIGGWHTYKFIFTGAGSGNIAFYVDDVFKANYSVASNINTVARTALLPLSSATRTCNFRFYRFTDNNNSASNRLYDARVHVPGDTVLRETVNGVDGTFSAAWVSNGIDWVDEGGGSTAYTITCDSVTDTHSAGDVTLIYSGAGTAYSITCATVTDSHSAGDVTLTYTEAAGVTITSEPLYDNTETLLASQALDYVAIYDNSTGELVLRVTGLSTNASGIFSVTDAALTSGVTYKLDWKVTIQSQARMPSKAAT